VTGSGSSARGLRCHAALAIVLDDLESERSVGSTQVAAARAHVEACPRCRAEVTRELLVLTGLHRLGDLVQAAELPEQSWGRVLARLAAEDERGQAAVRRYRRGVVLPGVPAGMASGLDLGRALAPLLAVAVVLPALVGGAALPVILTGGPSSPGGAPVVRPEVEVAGMTTRDVRLREEVGREQAQGSLPPAPGGGLAVGNPDTSGSPAVPPSTLGWAADGTLAAPSGDGRAAATGEETEDVAPARGAERNGPAASVDGGSPVGAPVGSMDDPAAAGEALAPRSGSGSLPRRD
jgi:hypothetical protein